MFKFRMALIEWPFFTKGDDVAFNVFIPGRRSNVSVPVEYWEKETLDAARADAHLYVDRYFDHQAHMEQLEKMAAENKRRFAAEAADLKQVNELVIARVPKKESKPTDDLLDLMGDVLGPDTKR